MVWKKFKNQILDLKKKNKKYYLFKNFLSHFLFFFLFFFLLLSFHFSTLPYKRKYQYAFYFCFPHFSILSLFQVNEPIFLLSILLFDFDGISRILSLIYLWFLIDLCTPHKNDNVLGLVWRKLYQTAQRPQTQTC